MQQAESVMEDALKELADMKSGGASMEDREAKLGNTEARLQTLLFNRAPVARDVPTDRPVRLPLACSCLHKYCKRMKLVDLAL